MSADEERPVRVRVNPVMEPVGRWLIVSASCRDCDRRWYGIPPDAPHPPRDPAEHSRIIEDSIRDHVRYGSHGAPHCVTVRRAKEETWIAG